jgi:UDP-glucose 4-epimerase
VFGTDYDTADGTCIRDFIHVGILVADLAAAHVLALRALEQGAVHDAYNLGTGARFLGARGDRRDGFSACPRRPGEQS